MPKRKNPESCADLTNTLYKLRSNGESISKDIRELSIDVHNIRQTDTDLKSFSTIVSELFYILQIKNAELDEQTASEIYNLSIQAPAVANSHQILIQDHFSLLGIFNKYLTQMKELGQALQVFSKTLKEHPHVLPKEECWIQLNKTIQAVLDFFLKSQMELEGC